MKIQNTAKRKKRIEERKKTGQEGGAGKGHEIEDKGKEEDEDSGAQ